MVTIIFEPHANTFDDQDQLVSGHYDSELSPMGMKQSHELGEKYKEQPPDVVFCSDLQRSYQTAEIAFLNKQISIIKDPRLRECDYGIYTRHSVGEVDPLKIQYIDQPFPEGESIGETIDRIKEFLNNLLTMYDEKRVMIVGHQVTYYGLEHWLKGVALEQVVSSTESMQQYQITEKL